LPPLNFSRLAAQATTLAERLTGDLPLLLTEPETLTARWEAWRAAMTPALFEKRLALLGLTPDAAQRALHDVSWLEERPLPAWATTLQSVLEIKPTPHACFDPAVPLPFEELCAPFLHWATRQLHWPQSFAVHAFRPLERHLLRRLSDLCAPVFYTRFVARRAVSRGSYAQFIAAGLGPFVADYPMLMRLAGTLMVQWVEATHEFCVRLVQDAAALRATFGVELSDIRALRPAASDAHHGGRQVVEITFASGACLFYKPRTLEPEATFFECVARLNPHLSLALATPRLLIRPTHGWMEAISTAPCETAPAAARFYQRAGALLALLYLLDATDAHYENLIISGEQPILVDLETLLQPRVMGGAEESPAEQFFWDSVLRTQLLPHWERGPRGVLYDISGLSSQPLPADEPQWIAINTDAMELRPSVSATLGRVANPPHLTAAAAEEALIAGFTEGYEQLQNRAPVDFERFAALTPRFVFRPTRAYHLILRHALQPRYLHSGLDFSLQLESLARAVVAAPQPEKFAPVLAEELNALAQLDFPRFTFHAAQVDLPAVPQALEQAPYTTLLQRLANLSAHDLAQQTAFIRGAWQARYAERLERPVRSNASQGFTNPEDLAQRLERQAIRLRDGSLTWLALNYQPRSGHYQFAPLGLDVYDGQTGVALFFAALYRVTREAHWRAFALEALQPVRRALQSTPSELGGLAGHASLFYGLTHCSVFLEEAALIAEAENALALITPELITADRTYDVISGAAGAILCWLAVHQKATSATPLILARLAGDHLLQQRTSTPNGQRAWLTLGGAFHPGFAHGVAGIAYALLQLTQATGDERYRDAAQEAIRYEQAAPRVTGDQALTWCHGMPGIGLARLGGLSQLNTLESQNDIEATLTATHAAEPADFDHLCCGNFCRAEFLFTAAQRLNRPELWRGALPALSAYRFPPAGASNAPGFFRGLAGVGYSLLRWSQPVAQLPSVLLLES